MRRLGTEPVSARAVENIAVAIEVVTAKLRLSIKFKSNAVMARNSILTTLTQYFSYLQMRKVFGANLLILESIVQEKCHV